MSWPPSDPERDIDTESHPALVLFRRYFYDWQFSGSNEEYLDPARYPAQANSLA